MNKILRFVWNVFGVSGVTLLGNWIGGQVRSNFTGKQVQTIQFKYKTKKGRSMTNAPVATKFYPGLFFSLIGKPRWLFAFIGGLVAGGFVPDHFEHYFLERVIEPLFIDRVLGES
jgi:hypothetical protein